jgi:hypothetical protein
MIIRKVKEIDSQGKMISTSKVDLDTKNVNIDQNKRTEASKKIEVNNIQANVLKGGKEDSTELNRIIIDVTIDKKKKIKNTTFYYRNRASTYDAQIYTVILEDPDDKTKRLFYTVGDIFPKEAKPIKQFDLIASKEPTTLEKHYKSLSAIIKDGQSEGDLDKIITPLFFEFSTFSKLLENYTNLNEIGNQMAFIGDYNPFGCIGSLINLGDCILTTAAAIELCPLCAQVVTCIPACVDVFSLPVCLLCEGTGLGGCAVCLIASYVCYNDAEGVEHNCFQNYYLGVE